MMAMFQKAEIPIGIKDLGFLTVPFAPYFAETEKITATCCFLKKIETNGSYRQAA